MENQLFPRMHVSLYVSSIAETVNFYNAFFGQQADKIKPGYAKYILEKPSLIISFVENKERVASHFGHLGFQVAIKEEMEQYLAIARAQNIVEKEETGTACCYAVQDKFWVNDPDGHQWEVYYFHEDAEFNDPHYEMGEASACCAPPVQERAKQEKTKVELKEISTTTSACCSPSSACC